MTYKHLKIINQFENDAPKFEDSWEKFMQLHIGGINCLFFNLKSIHFLMIKMTYAYLSLLCTIVIKYNLQKVKIFMLFIQTHSKYIYWLYYCLYYFPFSPFYFIFKNSCFEITWWKNRPIWSIICYNTVEWIIPV